ncbi:histo-blood group ABO system transferase-like [Otolemur garnettii]|uniref:histo-blood group ABO system transferase-like n=1 Tax=Otolemur garnettii TaxID=30611 RepID=UPI0006440868|nr:histo-blood group ABO system transferase-like [Otolemur garnettii]
MAEPLLALGGECGPRDPSGAAAAGKVDDEPPEPGLSPPLRSLLAGRALEKALSPGQGAQGPAWAWRSLCRRLQVLQVRAYARWQDVSMRRMQMIADFAERRFLGEVDYLVCVDVDMRFRDHVGVEILSPLFGTLHPGYYRSPREAFPYERRPQSQAYIPRDEGDFYYLGGFFGGSTREVQRLTRACHQAMTADRAKGVEAVWHDESHLNWYLLHHKPTRVLSPEYLWDEQLLGWPPVLKKLRFVAVPKNHQEIRKSDPESSEAQPPAPDTGR